MAGQGARYSSKHVDDVSNVNLTSCMFLGGDVGVQATMIDGGGVSGSAEWYGEAVDDGSEERLAECSVYKLIDLHKLICYQRIRTHPRCCPPRVAPSLAVGYTTRTCYSVCASRGHVHLHNTRHSHRCCSTFAFQLARQAPFALHHRRQHSQHRSSSSYTAALAGPSGCNREDGCPAQSDVLSRFFLFMSIECLPC